MCRKIEVAEQELAAPKGSSATNPNLFEREHPDPGARHGEPPGARSAARLSPADRVARGTHRGDVEIVLLRFSGWLEARI